MSPVNCDIRQNEGILSINLKGEKMGKIKQALICWNEDNGYEPTQISGWDANKKASPTIQNLVDIAKVNRKLINKLIKENK